MAKESMKAREVKREKTVAKYAEKRKALLEAGDYEGLQRLPKNYPEIMISLYGIYCEKKSIVTLSKEYGLCEERIKQINKHCLKLLKENELNKDLKNYL